MRMLPLWGRAGRVRECGAESTTDSCGSDGKFQKHKDAWDAHRPSVTSFEEDAEAETVKKGEAALKASTSAGLAKEVIKSLKKGKSSARRDQNRNSWTRRWRDSHKLQHS